MIKVLEVNNIDTFGKAFNGYDLINDLSDINIDVKQAVVYKKSNNNKVINIFNNPNMYNNSIQLNKIEEKLSIHNLLSITSPALIKLKEYKEADIIHFHMFHNSNLSLASLLNISREKKIIITLHDPWFLTGRCVHFFNCDKWENGCQKCPDLSTHFPFKKDNCHKMWKIKKEVLNNSNIEYVVTSKWMYDLAMKSEFIIDKSCIHFIPLGVNLNLFKTQDIKKRYNIPKEDIILFLRAQNEFKGTKYVLEALKELKTDYKISIITCDNKGLLNEIKNKYNIIDLGFISEKEIINVFNLCDIFLMPSLGESFGMMGVEAMACSKPVIAFDNTAIPSVLNAPECGYIVKNQDSHELMLAIKDLIENKEERIKRGKLGRKICEKNYSYDNYILELKKLYNYVNNKKYLNNLTPYKENIDNYEYLSFKNTINNYLNNSNEQEIDINEYNLNYLNKYNEYLYEKLLMKDEKIRSFYPKISVIIPVYNGGNFLSQAIESVLNQTYQNYEIIVVDDGSTDNTRQIAKRFKDKIKYYYKNNGGVASALNYGIKKMTGDYFAWLSHDDVYTKDKLEIQIDFLTELKDKNTILFSNFNLVDSNNRIITKTNYLANLKVEELCVGYYPVVKGCINGCTILINKNCFEKVGLFDESLKTTQDYDMWLRLFKQYPSYCIPNCLVNYRIHPKQDTNSNPITPIEGNAFWENLVNNLTENEIKAWNKDLFETYMDLANQMKNSNFIKAYQIALNKAKNNYKNPIISIIMPYYNAEKYIDKAIDSILNQIFNNFELIIVNDNSNDNSTKIVKEYLKKDFRIKLYKNEYQKGVSGALNTGLDKAKGKYFARLDSDDTLLPEKLLKQILIIKEEKYGYIGTNINFIDSKSKIINQNVYKDINAPIEYLIAFKNPIPNATILYDLNLIRKYNLKFANLKTAEDYHFLLNFIYTTKSKGYFINEGLYNYRILDNSLFHSNIQESTDNAKKMAEEYYKKISNKVNEDYSKACEFYYLEKEPISAELNDIMNVYREFYESSNKYFKYNDKEKNAILIYIVNTINDLKLNQIEINDKKVFTAKKAYHPKTKIGNKYLYYYRTHGLIKTGVWILTYPVKKVSRKLKK